MKKISILMFIAFILALSGCNGKSKAKSSDHNTTTKRSEAAKSMDSELLPEGGGKKMPMF